MQALGGAALALTFAICSGPAGAAAPPPAKQLTVERIYGAPSLSGYPTPEVEWSPDSKRISYLSYDRPGLELVAMDASTGERKVLVKADVLDRVRQEQASSAVQSTGLGRLDTNSYQWSPRGDAILFTGANALVLLDLKTLAFRTLAKAPGDIEDAKFSPDGKWVSYVHDFNLWVVSVSGGEPRALTGGGSEAILKGKLDWVYPEELDLATAYWWAPDSSQIAYYEMDERPVTRYPIVDMSSPAGAIDFTRYPQAGEANPIVRVGVVPVVGGETHWIDTGADKDIYPARVVWLRDSRRLAIERLNRAQNRLDLLFCDATTGASQTVLTDTDKYWINIADDLYFFADGKRFLWSSERTGFRHYYIYDLNGRELETLTSGDWPVTGNGDVGPGADSHAVVDETHDFVYFLSNKDNALEIQLYRVSPRDKTVTRVSAGPGTHRPLIAPDASAFVDTHSTAMTPPREDVYRADSSFVAALNENKVSDLAGYHLAPVEFVNAAAADGTKLYGSLIKPSDFNPSKKYPVLINVYGGPQVQQVRNEWGGSDLLWHEMMAQKGFVIFELDGRGSWNRGHAFETPLYRRLGQVELQDQLAGANYLKSLSYVDRSRIGIWGWSYGGTMVLEALFNEPNVFKAGVAVAPVSDWRLYDTIYTERYLGLPKDNPSAYHASSPAFQAASLRGKLMLAHGTGDDNVHFANTSEVINELLGAQRYPDEVMILPGRGHSIADIDARIELFNRITAFLLRNL